MCYLYACIFSSPGSKIPKGLTAGKDKSIAVTFHVLLPKQIWEWDVNSMMFIKFGDDELGGWNYHCGPLKEYR